MSKVFPANLSDIIGEHSESCHQNTRNGIAASGFVGCRLTTDIDRKAPETTIMNVSQTQDIAMNKITQYSSFLGIIWV